MTYKPGGGEEQNDRNMIQNHPNTLEQWANETKRINTYSQFELTYQVHPGRTGKLGFRQLLWDMLGVLVGRRPNISRHQIQLVKIK